MYLIVTRTLIKCDPDADGVNVDIFYSERTFIFVKVNSVKLSLTSNYIMERYDPGTLTMSIGCLGGCYSGMNECSPGQHMG